MTPKPTLEGCIRDFCVRYMRDQGHKDFGECSYGRKNGCNVILCEPEHTGGKELYAKRMAAWGGEA